MIEKFIFPTREEWLQGRAGTIGGSDAGCILGVNKWKSNLDLWEEMTGKKEPDDISNNSYVWYGIEAEKYIRGLFELDYPNMKVWYEENNLFKNSRYPWAHYSADGMLQDIIDHTTGILEIKTASISSSAAAEKWRGNRMPDGYFAQILHSMAVMNAQFAYLRALIKYPPNDEGIQGISIRDYMIRREDVEDDIEYLMEEEEKFYECVKKGIEPARTLPSI